MYSPKISKRNEQVGTVGDDKAKSLREKVFRDNKHLDKGGPVSVRTMSAWRSRQTGYQEQPTNLSKVSSISSCDLSTSGGYSPDANTGKSLHHLTVPAPWSPPVQRQGKGRRNNLQGTNLTRGMSSSSQDVRVLLAGDGGMNNPWSGRNQKDRRNDNRNDISDAPRSPTAQRQGRSGTQHGSNLSRVSSSSSQDVRAAWGGDGGMNNPWSGRNQNDRRNDYRSHISEAWSPRGQQHGRQDTNLSRATSSSHQDVRAAWGGDGGMNSPWSGKQQNRRNDRQTNLSAVGSASTCDLTGVGAKDPSLSPGPTPQRGWENPNLKKVGHSASMCDLRQTSLSDSPKIPRKSRKSKKRKGQTNQAGTGNASSHDSRPRDFGDSQRWKTEGGNDKTNLNRFVSSSSVDLRHSGWNDTGRPVRPDSLLLSPLSPRTDNVSYSDALKLGSQSNLSQMHTRSASSFDLRDIGRLDSPSDNHAANQNDFKRQGKSLRLHSPKLSEMPISVSLADLIQKDRRGKRADTKGKSQDRRRTFSECDPQDRLSSKNSPNTDLKPWIRKALVPDLPMLERMAQDDRAAVSPESNDSRPASITKDHVRVENFQQNRQLSSNDESLVVPDDNDSSRFLAWKEIDMEDDDTEVNDQPEPEEDEVIERLIEYIDHVDGDELSTSTNSDDFSEWSDQVRKEIMDIKCQMKLSAIQSVGNKTDNHGNNLNSMIRGANILKDSIQNQFKEVGELRKRTKTMLVDFDRTDSMLAKIEARYGDMKKKNLRNELESLKNNILILGIREVDNECSEDTVRAFFQKRLGIEAGPLVKTCRLGFPRAGVDRAIRVVFPTHKDKELMKRAKFRLKGTHYVICDEYPKEIEAHRKKLYPVLREARKDGKRTKLKLDTLLIEGEVYRGAGPGPLGYRQCENILSLTEDARSDSEV